MPEEVRRLASLLERRWTIAVIYASSEGVSRFNEFVATLGAIPAATLAARLAELEEAGLLRREVVQTRPPHSEYHLTERGAELAPLIRALAMFSR